MSNPKGRPWKPELFKLTQTQGTTVAHLSEASADREYIVRWRSWEPTRMGVCEFCNDDSGSEMPQQIMIMIRRDDGRELALCFDCYITAHERLCGCKLWKRAKAAFDGEISPFVKA